MSVAPELPPVVYIPDAARAGRREGRGGLRLVPALPAGPAPEPADDSVPEAWFEPAADLDLLLCAPAAVPSAVPAVSPPAARPVGAAASRLRLTARGRLVLTALAVLVAGVLIALAYAGASSAAPAPARGPAAVVVAPGDTLWSIAARVAPAADPRREVDLLRRLNHLSGVAVTPGQVLRTR